MEQTNEWAVCKICRRSMKPKNGCGLKHILINGKLYKRIKAGDELDSIPNMDENFVCHDCNVSRGQYHHPDCDMEICPVCRDQLFLCDCAKQLIVSASVICPKSGR